MFNFIKKLFSKPTTEKVEIPNYNRWLNDDELEFIDSIANILSSNSSKNYTIVKQRYICTSDKYKNFTRINFIKSDNESVVIKFGDKPSIMSEPTINVDYHYKGELTWKGCELIANKLLELPQYK